MLDIIEQKLLFEIADLHGVPKGAYNIRKNGAGVDRNTTNNIDIVTKTDKPGIDIVIKPNTKGESVHIPVIISESGLEDVVYNTFYVGENADVLIVAGCGIHNSGEKKTQHDGVHEFFVEKNARMKYVEKHYGEGTGSGDRIFNPKTVIEVGENAVAELEMIQISGVDNTLRDTEVVLHKNAKLIISERLLTEENQVAVSKIDVKLNGEDSSAQVVSRSVARDQSKQEFHMSLSGQSRCKGHIQCDSIILDSAEVSSTPQVFAKHSEAELIHEAAIGRIAAEQLVKIMSLGIPQKDAESIILNGFLE